MMCDDDDAMFAECATDDDDDEKADVEQSFSDFSDDGSDDDDSSDSGEEDEKYSAGTAESSGQLGGQTSSAAHSVAYVNTDDGFLKSVLSNMEQSSIKRRKRKCDRTFKSDFKYEMEHMTTRLETQQRLCAVSFLPFTFRRLSDWQLSPDRHDNDEDYIPTNVRLVCLEFNGRCSWSSNDITEFHRLALLPLDDAYVARAMVSAHQEARTTPHKPQSRPGATGNEEWKCGECDKFVELGCMKKGRKSLCKPCSAKRDREYRKSGKVSGSKRKRHTPASSRTTKGVKEWMCHGCDKYKPETEMKKNSKTWCNVCNNKSSSSSINAELRVLLKSAIANTEARNEKIKERNKKRHRNAPPLKRTITLAVLIALYEQQQGRCFYSNVGFQHRSLLEKGEVKGEVFNKLRQMSLERLDPRRGYELDNVRLICLGFQGTDKTRGSKHSNGGSGGWSRAKVAYLFKWWIERAAGASQPSVSWLEFKATFGRQATAP